MGSFESICHYPDIKTLFILKFDLKFKKIRQSCLTNSKTSKIMKWLPNETVFFRSRNGKSRRQRDRARAHVDYEEMTVSYGRIKLGVPSGFRELLEDLTRGVIRDRPNNIPLYLQRHFQELVEHERNEREAARRKREAQAKAEAERLEQERLAEIERQAAAKKAAEEEAARIAAEKAEIARKAQEAEELENARLAAEEKTRLEKERLDAEAEEAQRLRDETERVRLEKEAEVARLAKEKEEKEAEIKQAEQLKAIAEAEKAML